MSSGFVSAGILESDDATTTVVPSNADIVTDQNNEDEPSGVDAWAAADAAVKAARERAANSSSLMGSQDGGKSLFEVLQANKAVL